jgi:hypothetical protein
MQDKSLRKFFQFKKIPYGIYPLFGMMTFALCGGLYFMIHTAGNPELEWNKNNRKLGIQYHDNYKLLSHQTTKIYAPTSSTFTEKVNRFFNRT